MQRIRSHANGTGRTTAAAASRRCFLTDAMVGMAVGLALPRVGWSIQSQDGANETEEIIAVQALAQKAGLGEFSTSRKEHFLGLGDAPEAFRKTALGICESLSVAFLSHFRDQGFNLVMPAHPLTVITLKDKDSYGAFLGEDPGKMVGGHYDLDTNRLVMFDFRPTSDQDDLQADPERVNLLALVHETTHLLCFNTGLLSRQTDVPDWVSEGLATYVELWQKNKRPAPDRIGEPTVAFVFASESRSWIPIADLVADDETFWDEKTQQLSYAESWLLVHYLMKSQHQRPKFRSYLAGTAQAKGRGLRRIASSTPKNTSDRSRSSIASSLNII